MLQYKYLNSLVFGQERSWKWSDRPINLISYIKQISNAVKTLFDNDTYYSSHNIPILLYDYSLDSQVQQELNEGGVCITIKFPGITSVQFQGPTARGILINGIIEIYELVTVNRNPDKIGWVEGIDVAEQAFGTMTDLVINDIIVKVYPESILFDNAISDKKEELIKYILRYNIKGYCASAKIN